MAVQSIGGPIAFPPPWQFTGGLTLTTNTYVLDAADEKVALVCRSPRAGNIRRIHFRTGTVTTGATLDCRIETVSAADGNPTGTLWATTTNAAAVVADTDDNTWKSSAPLTADATVAQGDEFAVVIVNPSGSPGNLQIGHFSDEHHSLYPYGALFTASYAKQTFMPSIALEMSDGTYLPIFGHYPVTGVNAVTYNSGSASDERGNRFISPFACRAVGAWVWHNGIGANVAFDVVLYDTAGTVAASGSFDGDRQQSVGTAGGLFIPFTASVTIAAATGSPYRVVLKPTSASNVTLLDIDVAVAAILDSLPGGAAWHYTERADAGAWSDTTTKRAMIGLLLDGL